MGNIGDLLMYTGFFRKNLVSMIDIYIEFVLQGRQSRVSRDECGGEIQVWDVLKPKIPPNP